MKFTRNEIVDSLFDNSSLRQGINILLHEFASRHSITLFDSVVALVSVAVVNAKASGASNIEVLDLVQMITEFVNSSVGKPFKHSAPGLN